MTTLGKLFGQSPFALLQKHMEHVAKCVHQMAQALDAFENGRWEEVVQSAEKVSILEHQADEIKSDIRHRLRKKLFLPIERKSILGILANQDQLADQAEDICVLLTLKKLSVSANISPKFVHFKNLNLKAFSLVEAVVHQLDELLETSFGGSEAEKVRSLIHQVALAEHEADVAQRELVKAIIKEESQLSTADFYLWMQLIKGISDLSNKSENLANRMQSTLELT